MNRIAIPLLLSALLCSTSNPQESDERRTGSDGSQTRERQAQQERRERRERPTIEVKDPAGFTPTQDRPIFSGPQPGEALPPFEANDIRSGRNGQPFDPVAHSEGGPQIILFAEGEVVSYRWLTNVTRIIAPILDKSEQGFSFTIVFLNDDLDQPFNVLRRMLDYYPESVQLCVSRDGRDGPGAYGLNRNVAWTFLLAKDGKVVRNFAFTEPVLSPDPHVLGGIAELIGVDRETIAAWLNDGSTEEMPMRRAAEERRQMEARRREESRRRRPQLEVKDPAEFLTERDQALFSGPQPGEPLPGFEVNGVQGELDGRSFDPTTIAEGRPILLIFQDLEGAGLRGLIQLGRLLPTIADRSSTDLTTSITLLGDDPNELTGMSQRIEQYLPESMILSISRDGRDGPGALGLNRNVGRTVILAKDGQVTHNFVFQRSGLYPDPHVLGGLAELLDVDRATLQSWLNDESEGGETMRMRRRSDRNRN